MDPAGTADILEHSAVICHNLFQIVLPQVSDMAQPSRFLPVYKRVTVLVCRRLRHRLIALRKHFHFKQNRLIGSLCGIGAENHAVLPCHLLYKLHQTLSGLPLYL